MKRRALLSSLGVAVCAAAYAAPGSLPGGWQAQNVVPVAYVTLDAPRTFKLSIRRVMDRWYLFVATGGGGTGPDGVGFQVLDVTDPAAPRHVTSVAIPYGNGQLTLHGDLLIAGRQLPFAPPDVGGSVEYPFRGLTAQPTEIATLFDISDPRTPKRLSGWTATGWATHRNSYPGGRYAFMSAWVEGYRGQSVLAILDVSDPRQPKEAGRWWWPGQRENEPLPSPPTGYHGPAHPSGDGRMLTLGYSPGLVNLDISDPRRPQLVGKLVFSPLAPVGTQAIHTVVPLRGGMLHVSTEPSAPGCDKESLPFAAIVDNREPRAPRLVAYYPRPVPAAGAPHRSFCEKEGRFGPHNVNTEIHLPDVQPPGDLVFMTYFNAGLRVFDVSDPYAPREAGWFLPEIGPWREGFRGLEDVLVDARSYIYATDGRGKGVWVLKHTGPAAGSPAVGAASGEGPPLRQTPEGVLVADDLVPGSTLIRSYRPYPSGKAPAPGQAPTREEDRERNRRTVARFFDLPIGEERARLYADDGVKQLPALGIQWAGLDGQLKNNAQNVGRYPGWKWSDVTIWNTDDPAVFWVEANGATAPGARPAYANHYVMQLVVRGGKIVLLREFGAPVRVTREPL